MKKAIALQLQRILEKEQVSKSQLAARMKTSRAALDRILDAKHRPLRLPPVRKSLRHSGTG